jgi:3-deoxy-manno-octulosonate cytidylyltransferase (CMP-KDO synthetase)
MSFIVIIPARLASTRLPNKPLADLGGKPMVVRVAERARLNRAPRASSSPPTTRHCRGLRRARHRSLHDARRSSVRHRPHRRSRAHARPAADAVVVNLQGDEPLIDPPCCPPAPPASAADVPMATCAHPLHDAADAFNPNVVKVVLDKLGRALYFSRATIPWHRDAFAQSRDQLPAGYVAAAPYRPVCLQQRFPAAISAAGSRRRWNDRSAGTAARALARRPDRRARDRCRAAAGVDTPEDLARVRAYYAS